MQGGELTPQAGILWADARRAAEIPLTTKADTLIVAKSKKFFKTLLF